MLLTVATELLLIGVWKKLGLSVDDNAYKPKLARRSFIKSIRCNSIPGQLSNPYFS